MDYIGIIGAMPEEVAQLIEQMEEKEMTEIAGMKFYDGKLWAKRQLL